MHPAKVRGELQHLKLVDYFPARHAWGKMWLQWHPREISSDLARIRWLHGNAVKVIVQPATIGFPRPRPVMLARLRAIDHMAAAHGLRVAIALFDGWDDFADLRGSRRWARAVLDQFKHGASVAYVDLHNEINLEPRSALSWAARMLGSIRADLPGVPVTASTTLQSGVSGLADVVRALRATPPDFYDVHVYGEVSRVSGLLRGAERLAAPRPIYIGETGLSSSGTDDVMGLPATSTAHLAYQAYYLRSVDAVAAGLGLGAPAPWILDDFTSSAMPNASVATPAGEHFGLYRVDGAAKPAAIAERQFLSSGVAGTDINGEFTQAVSVSATLEPAVWREWQPNLATFRLERKAGRSGRGAAVISGSGEQPGVCPAFYVSPIGVIRPGAVYSLTGLSRGIDTAGIVQLAIAWVDQNGRYLSEASSPQLPGGNSQWTRLSVKARAPAGAGGAVINLKSCRDPGSAWFTGIEFGAAR